MIRTSCYENAKTDELIGLAKGNICQLMELALYDSDEHIEKHFGGEFALLGVIKSYVELLEKLQVIKESEDK